VALVSFIGEAATDCFLDILAATESAYTPVKELRLQCPAGHPSWARGSFVVSTSTLPDWGRTRASLLAAGGGKLEVEEDLGAVSLIGVGINPNASNVSRAARILGELGAPILALSTSGFRISFVTESGRLEAAVHALHAAFIEGDRQAAPVEADA
jgi:hypothetical protein